MKLYQMYPLPKYLDWTHIHSNNFRNSNSYLFPPEIWNNEICKYRKLQNRNIQCGLSIRLSRSISYFLFCWSIPSLLKTFQFPFKVFTLYCIKRVWFDQSKKGMDLSRQKLTVHAVSLENPDLALNNCWNLKMLLGGARITDSQWQNVC
jgi:hypothetical protein